jgi:VanZ family protein
MAVILPKLIQAYFPVVAWSALIFFLSSQPQLPGPDLFAWDYFFKKMAHLTVYYVLFRLTCRGMSIHLKFDSTTTALLAVLFCLVYAATDEFHQSFVPGRTATVRDLLYDGLGIAIGWLRYHRYV